MEFIIKYSVGSIVYPIYKAEVGILEKVAIKSYHVLVEQSTENYPVVRYKDTFNAIWFEDELCSKTEAVELATNYYNQLLEEIDEFEE